jgi:CheY-like chemotaxis protein
MLTRKRHRQDVKRAVDVGVTDYVIKPIDEHLFLDKVELCLKKGTGKRHILECSLHGDQAQGEIGLSCKIMSISESYLTCELSLPVPLNLQCEIRATIFEEIGISPPLIKLITCGLVPSTDARESTYEAKFSFIGVPEPDLRKIRTWLNRVEIQRRK